MLELYHNEMSVCAAKVRLVLAEKGLRWKGHVLDLRAGDSVKPEYLKLNRHGVVPTLVHDSRVVIESNVICEYLDDAFPEPPLRPHDPHARARMRLWMKQLDDGIHAAAGTLSTCIAFRHQHLKRPPEEFRRYLEAIPQADRRERIQRAVELGMDSPGFAPAVRRFDTLFSEIERTLTHTDWLAGDGYSLADIAYTPYMVRMDHLGFADMVRSRPRLLAWKDRVFARQSYKPAVADWFKPAYLELFEQQRDAAREKAARILMNA